MNVLIACEQSGVMRRAFHERGHFAVSADILPAADGDPWQMHYHGDALDLLAKPWLMLPGGEGYCGNWDLLIAHPPCTFLNMAGIRWLYKKGQKKNGKDLVRWANMRKAATFYNRFRFANVPRVCVENSKMHPYALALCDQPTQVVQPWMFGTPEFKGISLQLKGLPPLMPTNELKRPKYGTREYKKWSKCHYASPGPNRGHERSVSYETVAAAMADQWGGQPIGSAFT